MLGLPISLMMFAVAVWRHVRSVDARGLSREGAAGSTRSSAPRFPRAALATAIIIPLLLAWLFFDLAPERRCRKAMQPFIDASGELLIVMNDLADRGQTQDALALIPSYRLLRGQGFMAAALEWIGSNGRVRMTHFGLGDPIWELSQQGRQAMIARLRADGSPRNAKLADSLSRIGSQFFSTHAEVDRLSNEFAGLDAGEESGPGGLVLMEIGVYLRRSIVRVELEASTSYLGGDRDDTFGIHRWIIPGRQPITPALWDATDAVVAEHLSPSTRKAVRAAQQRYDLRAELVP